MKKVLFMLFAFSLFCCSCSKTPRKESEKREVSSSMGFTEIGFTVTNGHYSLPGLLTLPVGDAPFAAAVLVHGSGPSDRDESIGANKPFRDLAQGLAERGVAVLRYDKRTKVYGPSSSPVPSEITLEEETIEDALSAIEQVRIHPSVDSTRIYVIGHSLGATCVPLIASRTSQIAGAVMLAPAARPLQSLVVEQTAYLLSLQHATEEEADQVLGPLMDEADRISEKRFSLGETLMGVPASYWEYLNGYDACATAASLTLPLLLLQGERDYQVTMEDYSLWKDALKKNKNVTMKSYPALNHLFMAGEGKSVPGEYNKASHVADSPIEDMVEWMKNNENSK